MTNQHAVLWALSNRLGINPCSYDFIRDPSYLEDRCSRVIGGQIFDGQSVLKYLLHSGLTKEDRLRIFPGEFDLGNSRSIPDKDCTYDALCKELEGQRTSHERFDNPLEIADVMRLLRDTSALLGHKPIKEQQVGSSQLFKVAKLLHSFKQRKGLLQLMSILRPPIAEAKTSLELTNPYQCGVDSVLRFQLTDLHAYLSVEISEERLADIDRTFGSVRAELDKAIVEIEYVLKSVGNPCIEEVVQRYDIAFNQWASHRSPPMRKLLRADEQLYVIMHVLDFLHFAKVENKLRNERLLQPSVTSISVAGDLANSQILLQDLCEHDVPDSVRQLLPLMNEATGEDISYRQFRDYLESAHIVLNHWVSLKQEPTALVVDKLTVLAAIIVAREMRRNPAVYKPGLHGSVRGQSQSVKAAFKANRPVSSSHEEFERIVYYAVHWTRYALSGQTAVLEAQLAFQMRLMNNAVSVLSTHDTSVMANFLSNLKGYAKYGVEGVLNLAALKIRPYKITTINMQMNVLSACAS